jgi:hypothetical protein
MPMQWFEPGWEPEEDDDRDEDSSLDWGEWFEVGSYPAPMGRDQRSSRARHPSSPAR